MKVQPRPVITGVYVITDEQLVPGRSHLAVAEAAVRGGASIVQLRDKLAEDEALAKVGLKIRQITKEAGVTFIVNDRVNLALACDADGAHIGASDCPVSTARRMLGDKILGVSASNENEARIARAEGADYIGVGPIYPTSTKADAGLPVGLSRIREMQNASGGLPIVAVGGIDVTKIGEVVRAGASAVAVISAVVCAPDMEEATRQLVVAWNVAVKNLNQCE